MRARAPFVSGLLLLLAVQVGSAQQPTTQTPADLLASALDRLVRLIEPPADTPPQTLTARLELTQAEGLPKGAGGQSVELAFQAPDRLRLAAHVGSRSYLLGRNGSQLWIYAPEKQFGVIGEPGRPRFASAPDKLDTTRLPKFKFPLPKEQVLLLPLLMEIEARPAQLLGDSLCHVLQLKPKPEAIQALNLPQGTVTLWVRTNDALPVRLGYNQDGDLRVELTVRDLKLGDPWPAQQWALPAKPGDTIERAAVSHLTKFLSVTVATATQKIPTLGPATGERRVVATAGQGRLELIDGTRVLFLRGSPREMGRQHGTLLKKEIREVTDRILYGVGVGSSFEKGRWFFAEIEEAQRRLMPFIDPRYLEEMDAVAEAAGLEKEEARLANLFPELFHCSGFALFGRATEGGRLYHGRILDYLRGVGLEQNAVVMVFQPDQGHAWVNVGYAGFIGTVTAMNAQHIAIGEMGGRGEGDWDGKPMAQLLREVMERASSLEQALSILRQGPRTCEYYYVLSDGRAKTAVGIAATPKTFELIWPGQAHPRLPEAIPDAVLLSAGERYTKLVERVREKYGKIDAAAARDLMRRPVAMTSNIHSALFAPETLDFWVANADSKNVASHCRFTHYNLAELLKSPPPATPPTSSGQ